MEFYREKGQGPKWELRTRSCNVIICPISIRTKYIRISWAHRCPPRRRWTALPMTRWYPSVPCVCAVMLRKWPSITARISPMRRAGWTWRKMHWRIWQRSSQAWSISLRKAPMETWRQKTARSFSNSWKPSEMKSTAPAMPTTPDAMCLPDIVPILP